MKIKYIILSLIFLLSCQKNTQEKNNIDEIVSKSVAKALDSINKVKSNKDSGNILKKIKVENLKIKPITTKELVRLSKKHFQVYKKNLLSKNTDIGLLDAYTGDFTNDGKEDVVLYYSIEPTDGGNMLAGQGLALYKNSDNNSAFIKTFNADFLFTMDKINNGKIWIKELEYTEDDPRCCPSIEKLISLTLSGTEIKKKYE